MKKLAIISHCILNQNIRASGVVTNSNSKKIISYLIKKDFDILQLSCPEIENEPIDRKKHGISYFLRDVKHNKICEKIINGQEKLICSYIEENGFICFIGVQGSPTCNANIRGWRDLRGNEKGQKMRGLLAQAIHDRFPDIILFNINTGKYCENSFKKLKNNLENIY